ncbi:collagenase-like [Choristoneura fumiferana]|uniref:collagenase-like n=1 Tax=Choristoneura fumiferana TaxID=7141 RepID=UPI003D1577EB
MRLFICSFVLFVCVSEVLSVYDYHARVGIPKAEILLQSENNIGVLGRIVGGAQATQFAYPYQAGVVVTLTSGWTSVCGGSLISNTRVLSAAHCWWDGRAQARTFQVVLGSLTLFSGGTRIDTSDVVVHGSWEPPNVMFDIAMVKITKVNYDNSIQAIPLPATADVNRDFAGLTAVASGFGKTSDAQNSFPPTTSLHHVTLQVITNAVCQQSYNDADVSIHGSHLCTSGAQGVGTCDGDSGGPLTAVWNNQRILIGVVSFGPDGGCQSGIPSVFTRVTSYLTWIQGNM